MGSASACSLIGNLDQFNGAVEAEGGSLGLDADAGVSDRSASDALPDRVGRAGDGGEVADASDDRAETEDGGGQDADGGAPDEGGSAPDGDDGGNVDAAVTWCTANATANTLFCNDFDEGKPYSDGFTTFFALADGGLVPSVVSSDFASPPSSLLVTTSAVASGSNEYEQLVAHVSENTSRIQLQFALKLVDYDVNVGDLSLVRIAFASGNWWVTWDLQSAATVYETLLVPDGGQVQETHPTPMPPLGEWVNVVFAVDVGAQTVSLTLNGTPALQDSISAPAASAIFTGGIGINYLQGPAQPMSIYYDNVAITTN
jgi:hypothetical protein